MLKTAIGTKKRHHSRKKTASANPAHKNQWKTARFFWPFFQLNPAPPTGFSKHFTVHRVVSPFPSFRHEAAVGEWCFQKFPLQPCHAIICFGGLKELDLLTQKGVSKDGFFPTCRFFLLSDVLMKRGLTKTGFVYNVTMWSKVSKADLPHYWSMQIDERLWIDVRPLCGLLLHAAKQCWWKYQVVLTDGPRVKRVRTKMT